MKAEIIVGSDQIEFMTRTNGDRVRIQGAHFTAEDAANLAHMINDQEQIKVVFKELSEGE
jgi:hypothetical protein